MLIHMLIPHADSHADSHMLIHMVHMLIHTPIHTPIHRCFKSRLKALTKGGVDADEVEELERGAGMDLDKDGDIGEEDEEDRGGFGMNLNAAGRRKRSLLMEQGALQEALDEDNAQQRLDDLGNPVPVSSVPVS